jgi:hypothetical protein
MWHRSVPCLFLLALSGCGDPPIHPTGPAAQITLTASPSPATPTICPVSSCGAGSDEVEILTTLGVVETAGGSGTLDGFTVVLRRDSDNIALISTTIGIGAGTRITANQTVSLPFGVHLPRASAGSAMTLTVTANARNDGNSAAVSATLAIPVAAYGG